VIDLVHREVEVACLPTDIPGSLDFDISELHVGQHIEAGQVPLPANVRLVTDPGQVLAVLALPRAEVEAEAAPAAAAAVEGEAAAAPGEPEVIKKGKEAPEAEGSAEKSKGKGEPKGKGDSKGKGESKGH
jgi:large subunit ribosomal protein L25